LKLDKTQFNLDIENIAIEKQLNYIDAVVYYCEQHDIEIEVAAKMVNKGTKEKIKANANTLNLLVDKTSSLPI
jgi:hypothetical protein